MQSQGLFIHGQWLAGQGDDISSVDPGTGKIFWHSQEASSRDIDTAVASARKAFPYWRRTTLEERKNLVEKFSGLLEKNKETLADLIGKETSKPLWESRTEITAMVGKVGLSIQSQSLRAGTSHQEVAAGTSMISHRPHGVLVVLGPYNFPGHLPNGHIVPALLAGNCVVFKPSEQTPAVAEAVVHLWQQAGLPAGVLNLVYGGRAAGEALTNHPDIDGVCFTGSSQTGFQLHRQFAGKPNKILALEMGGNNPLIFDEVDNVKAAVYNTLFSAFVSAGQRCTCARRLYIPETAQGDAFLKSLITATEKLRVGKYRDDPQPFMGGVISSHAKEHLLIAQDALIQKGANSLLKMVSHNTGHTSLKPGLIEVTGVEDIPDEEYFGPLLQIHRYDTFEEALTLANNTRFGLSAGLLSKHREKFDYFYNEINAGIVNWNKPLTGASSAAPFGGIGASGNHRPSAFYAADYCAYPVASLIDEGVNFPDQLVPGVTL